MVREHLSAVNVKDGVENPGCNGWVLVTTGQELWRERVLHEKDAAFRAVSYTHLTLPTNREV